MATRAIYQVIRKWTNYDGWDISNPVVEESFEDEQDAKDYLARNQGDSAHRAHIERVEVQVAKPKARTEERR
jgi:hypothetical protein